MKSVFTTMILVVYLAVSSGVIINSHYCMNRLASTELFAFKGERCGKCGMLTKTSHGCCRDEVRIVKMDEDQKITPAFSVNFALFEAPVQQPSAFIITAFENAPASRHFLNHSPPLLSLQDSYLQNSVFRI